jgi:8-oxo-dGTP pyrophosphatase MutT (NUDIX family)
LPFSTRPGPAPAYALALCAALLALVACSESAPPCPLIGEGDRAPSAGCFEVFEGELLLVQGLDGKINLPGGSSQPGESAQCTAFRETWEETGLTLNVEELLRVFDTGFHLYRCQRGITSGAIDPPLRLEVRDAFYLSPERFDEYEWRYDDREVLREMVERVSREH